jgi:WD40 repeat protein
MLELGKRTGSLAVIEGPWIQLFREALKRGSGGFLEGAATSTAIAWSPNGKLLAVGEPSSTVMVWDVDLPDRTGIALHSDRLVTSGLAWRHDSQELATVGLDKIQIWNVRSAISHATSPVSGAHALSWSPDGTQLAVLGNERIAIMNPASGALVRAIDTTSRIVMLRRFERFITIECKLPCWLN